MQIRTAFFAVLIALVLGSAGLPTAIATDYYVSPTGNDANAGTSSGAPLKYIQTAIDKTVAGDFVRLMPGTHVVKPGDLNITFSGKRGTAAAPITLTTTAAGVVIDLSAATIGWGGFRISDSAGYIVVDGGGTPCPFDESTYRLVIKNAAYNAATGDARSSISCRPMTIQSADHITVKNICGKHSMGSFGIFGATATDIWVENCRAVPGDAALQAGVSHCFYVGSGADRVTIKHCFAKWGGESRLGLQNNGGGVNVTMDDCYVTECASGIKAFNGGAVTAKNSWFYNNFEVPPYQGPVTLINTSTSVPPAANTSCGGPANQPPVIDSPVSASPNPVVNANTTSVSVTAHDPDSGPSALTYTWTRISGAGTVSFSPNTTTTSSVATATFTASGTYSLQVTVTDGTSSVTSSITGLSVTLPAGGTAPSITAQPASQTVTAGATATFSASASGSATLTYQWQKNGANIAGATASSYTTPATVTGDNGATFRVIVTNGFGTATSNSATLTVNAAGNPVNASVTTVTLPSSPSSSTPVSRTFTLTNTSASTVTVTITDGQSWLTTSPASPISIAPGATVTITVTGNPTGYSGVVTGSLTLTTNPGGQVRTIPVTMDLTSTAAAKGPRGGGCRVDGTGQDWNLPLMLAGVCGWLFALRFRRVQG
jgi:hypothetical protein